VGRASWCRGGQWVCRGRDQSAVSDKRDGAVRNECQEEQESVLRTASLGEGAVSQGGAEECSTFGAAPESPSLR